jgi:hypothetical protein
MSRRTEGSHHCTQTAQIVDLLRSRNGEWVPLPEILALGIAQYNARIYTGRHELGLRIENRTQVIDGVRHSWFRLGADRALERVEASTPPPFAQMGDTPSLFQGAEATR